MLFTVLVRSDHNMNITTLQGLCEQLFFQLFSHVNHHQVHK